MKKLVVFLMMFALLLSAACGKQPQDSETPTVPSEPATEAPTQAPTEPVTELPTEAPTEPDTEPATEPATQEPTQPQTPVLPEPEGFVSTVMLPGGIPDLNRVGEVIPLEGNVVALLAVSGDQTQIVICDMVESTVLSRLEVSVYESSGVPQLSLLESDPWTLLYFDGRAYWKVTADSNWQLQGEKYDPTEQLRVMGSFTVEQVKDGISVDGTVPDVLKNSTTGSCGLLRILDDHRLLYQRTGASAMDSHVGVYDHSTGEVRPVTTVGQQALGVWGDSLIVVRGKGPVFMQGRIDLTDYSYAPIEIRHTMGDRPLDAVLCNADGTRMMVSWTDGGGTHVQVLDPKDGTVLYQWTATTDKNSWSFYPVDENGLLVQLSGEGVVVFWKVQY